MLGKLRTKLKLQLVDEISRKQEIAMLLTGLTHARHVKALGDSAALRDTEFRVFSQFGEDGILQYLIAKARPECEFFVEIGVQNYTESNTRFLLLNDNWSGAVVDGSSEAIEFIRNDGIHWRHDLRVQCRFVTAENIETVLADCSAPANLGLLSIDVDGIDFWAWRAVQSFRPTIVVCEYNSLFGERHAVTIPYNAHFVRTEAHHSNLYFGASLPALCQLAEQKGYAFVGANSAGNNAFFVRQEAASRLRTFTAKEGYVAAKFREARDAEGNLTYLDRKAGLKLIANCDLVSASSGKPLKVKNIVD